MTLAADEAKPLAGRSVVVTRAPEQAGELVAELQRLGAKVLLLPAVTFAAPEDTAGLDAALRALDSFDWVLLTSQNSARYFCARGRELGISLPAAGNGPRFAAVGPATARTAKEENLRPHHVAERPSGEGLAAELSAGLGGKRVLLPRSDRARPELPAALRAAGAEVTEVVAYRTLRPERGGDAVLERVRRGEVDVLTFASPSAFEHLSEELGGNSWPRICERVALAAIGPTTAEAIRDAGLPVAIEAAEFTSAGFAAAIAAYFQKHPVSGVQRK